MKFREVQNLIGETLENAPDGSDSVGNELDQLYEKALAAMLNDLNTPEAYATLLQGMKVIRVNSRGMTKASGQAAAAWLERMDKLLGLFPSGAVGGTGGVESLTRRSDIALTERVEALLSERRLARQDRDFAKADSIRKQLTDELGVEIRDTGGGTIWQLRPGFRPPSG